MASPSRMFDAEAELGGDTYRLEFTIPPGWEIEYVRSLDALNVYTLAGEGTARERSQILIQHFDASEFLTLQTVTIHRIEDTSIGMGNYMARRYDIEKKPGVAVFKDQPSWRNQRHIATDFRASEGRTRYYTVAANPDLDEDIYKSILASMRIK